MFIQKYKNSLLYHYTCKICGRAWNDDGEELTEPYLRSKIQESETTLVEVCPICENMNKQGAGKYPFMNVPNMA